MASSVNNERKSRLFSKDKSSGFSLKQQKQGSSGGVTSTSHSSRGTSLTGPSASSDQSNVILITIIFEMLFFLIQIWALLAYIWHIILLLSFIKMSTYLQNNVIY